MPKVTMRCQNAGSTSSVRCSPCYLGAQVTLPVSTWRGRPASGCKNLVGIRGGVGVGLVVGAGDLVLFVLSALLTSTVPLFQ